ncbi:MAG: NAD(P)H-dependent oxidoreductase [Rubellimicrobium sp.]|nr:NAD(P)H-dependent oxidoreductase [Rubellimicrobium sp.]
MPAALIIHAHPEPASFTAAWARASAAGAAGAGYLVMRSDLYAQGFDPAEGPGHYAAPPRPFDPLKAQEGADPLPADAAAEMEKVRAAELIVLHFPLWWFAPPAMIKGWTERALIHGHLHRTDARFDTGLMHGKRVLFCVTTGADAAQTGPDGKEADTRLLLWPLAHTFRYCGATVVDPVLLHGVHGYAKGAEKPALEHRLAAALAAQAGLIAGIAQRPVWSFNSDADFDRSGRLRPDAPIHSPFITHGPAALTPRPARQETTA